MDSAEKYADLFERALFEKRMIFLLYKKANR